MNVPTRLSKHTIKREKYLLSIMRLYFVILSVVNSNCSKVGVKSTEPCSRVLLFAVTFQTSLQWYNWPATELTNINGPDMTFAVDWALTNNYPSQPMSTILEEDKLATSRHSIVIQTSVCIRTHKNHHVRTLKIL